MVLKSVSKVHRPKVTLINCVYRKYDKEEVDRWAQTRNPVMDCVNRIKFNIIRAASGGKMPSNIN
jgi:hypothetical protein